LYQIGAFKDAFESLKMCDANYNDCGFNIGRSYRILSGYGMPNVTVVGEPEFNLQHADTSLFIDGLLEGFDCEHMRTLRAEITNFL